MSGIHYCVRLQKHKKANDAMKHFIQIAFPNLAIWRPIQGLDKHIQ